MASRQIIFRDEPLVSFFEGRTGGAWMGNPNEQAQTCIHRYLKLLRHASRSVHLTQAEACLLCDVGNGIMRGWFDLPPESFLLDIEYAVQEEGAAEKWGLDPEELMQHLRGLTVCQWAAVIEAVETFWSIQKPTEPYETAITEAFHYLLRPDQRAQREPTINPENI